MEKVVAGKIFNNINIKGCIQQIYKYDTRWKKYIVAIIHFYGAKSILLLFYFIQELESELCKILIVVAGPILTYKKIPKALSDNYIYTVLDRSNIL